MQTTTFAGTLVLLLASCVAGGGPARGEAATGPKDRAGRPTVYATRAEPVGANCAYGGTALLAGEDEDHDGELDSEEIESTSYICNGAPGAAGATGAAGTDGVDGEDGADGEDGLSTLIGSEPAPAGGVCAAGGTVLSWGRDVDRDNVLDAGEVEGAEYVCDGVDGTDGRDGADGRDGRDALVAVSRIPAGAGCPRSGALVRSGLDLDRDGFLDPDEVAAATVVCDGADGATGATGAAGATALVSTSDEPVGARCAAGGQRIDAGLDDDGDGVLDGTEIRRTSYVCNGVEGADGGDGAPGTPGAPGATALVRTTPIAAGETCPAGGALFEAGLDTNGNGVLDDAEVTTSQPVCNGTSGSGGGAPLVRIETEPSGPNCRFGGSAVLSGLDQNADGVLQDAEVTGTDYACMLGTITGDVFVTSDSGLEALRDVEEVVGNVTISGVTRLAEARHLTRVRGFLTVSSTSALTSLAGFDALTTVFGDLNISGIAALTSLAGLDALSFVGGRLAITFNAALTSLAGLGALSTLGGLYCRDNTQLIECEPYALRDRLLVWGLTGTATISGNLACSGACSGPVCIAPTAEVCDGIDNDLDGVIDDAPTDPWMGQACCSTGNLADCGNTGTGTRCRSGSYACAAGARACVGSVAKTTEILANGIDEDCDGLVDEPASP